MTTTVCVCVHTHMCVLGTEDRLSATEPCCGLIPSQVTKGHMQGHMCVPVCVHEREGLSASVCMQAVILMHIQFTHTLRHRYFHLHTTGLGRFEQHRGPTVCPKPTVHSFLSHWTFYSTQHHIWTTETPPSGTCVYMCEKVCERNETSSHAYQHVVCSQIFILKLSLKFQKPGLVETCPLL